MRKEILMKNLMKNIIVFIALSISLSALVGCSKTADSSKDSAEKTNSATAKNNDYPPVPSGIMQAEIRDVDGNTFKLEDKKGKVLLVNLWATWCGPCRKEMPDFVELQDKYRDQNFEIIGLNTDDESVEDVKSFAKAMKLNYLLGYTDGKFFIEFFKVTRQEGSIPQTMLINREGRLTGVFLGAGAANVAKIKDSVEKAISQ